MASPDTSTRVLFLNARPRATRSGREASSRLKKRRIISPGTQSRPRARNFPEIREIHSVRSRARWSFSFFFSSPPFALGHSLRRQIDSPGPLRFPPVTRAFSRLPRAAPEAGETTGESARQTARSRGTDPNRRENGHGAASAGRPSVKPAVDRTSSLRVDRLAGRNLEIARRHSYAAPKWAFLTALRNFCYRRHELFTVPPAPALILCFFPLPASSSLSFSLGYQLLISDIDVNLLRAVFPPRGNALRRK